MTLIILAHPNFQQSVANKTIITELADSGLDIEIRDLCRLYPHYDIDAGAEQAALLQHKAIVFQYPLYWYNMPAILKQWFDTVFEYQFAYGRNGDKLKDKLFIPSFTVGAPQSEYQPLGEHHFKIEEFCKNLAQTAYYTQMQYIEPVYFHGTSLNAGYTENDIRQKAAQQAQRLIQLIKTLAE
ncbi:NAD(P)H-dependent oxidoreductase [Uruburuella testudinis]|uniref:NAD(P)H-dependent oxidoreductase n=1 Tax=Uruburuella testudinis TaxID=1282863 RepID=A0ABY4DTB3_9NEIS|nr:NAD(P)H-dependent oxidoreductase [Uruburuella testudinis]UOO82270.1 NAD(P)H-dependent oxidoreductase [Uruburuella testudinis]